MRHVWLVWIGRGVERGWLYEWHRTKAEANKERKTYCAANLVTEPSGVMRFDASARSGSNGGGL